MCLELGGAKDAHPCCAAGLSLSTVPVDSHPVLPTVPKLLVVKLSVFAWGW